MVANKITYFFQTEKDSGNWISHHVRDLQRLVLQTKNDKGLCYVSRTVIKCLINKFCTETNKVAKFQGGEQSHFNLESS